MDAGVFDYPFFNQGYYHRHHFWDDRNIYGPEDVQKLADDHLLQVKGFIFHASHCGSTLLARMLGKLPGVRVVSETEAINGLLLSTALNSTPENDLSRPLKEVMDAYRQPLSAEKFLIFKFTSWNVFFIKIFLQLYPGVPWIFLDRETEEIVTSLLQNGGGIAEWWHHAGDHLQRYFTGNPGKAHSREDFLRQMVERHRNNADRNRNGLSLFLDYPGWITDFEHTVIPHFGIPVSEPDIRNAQELTRYNAKTIGEVLYQKE